MATARESVFYAANYTNKYLADHRKLRQTPDLLPFEATIVSASATGDTYKLCVIPANARVVALYCVANALSASAAVAIAVKIGDSVDDDRYMASSDLDVVNQNAHLAAAGSGYTPTADTIVTLTITGTAIVGRVISGWIAILK